MNAPAGRVALVAPQDRVRYIVAAGMGSRPARLAVLVAALALASAGCGQQRQDANAPSGEFTLEVTGASFPAEQQIAEPATLRLEVANRGDRAVPAGSVLQAWRDDAICLQAEPEPLAVL